MTLCHCLTILDISVINVFLLLKPLRVVSHPSSAFVPSSEYDDQKYRVRAIHALVHKLPEKNRTLLDLLTKHLYKYVHMNTCCPLLSLRQMHDDDFRYLLVAQLFLTASKQISYKSITISPVF